MTIAMACDERSLALKEALKKHLEDRGFTCMEFSDVTGAANAVSAGVCERGIVLDEAGVSACVEANHVRGVRCAPLNNTMSARMTREHNDTNMMTMASANIGQMLALEIADKWLDTAFSGVERHQRRIDKVMAYEA